MQEIRIENLLLKQSVLTVVWTGVYTYGWQCKRADRWGITSENAMALTNSNYPSHSF